MALAYLIVPSKCMQIALQIPVKSALTIASHVIANEVA